MPARLAPWVIASEAKQSPPSIREEIASAFGLAMTRGLEWEILPHEKCRTNFLKRGPAPGRDQEV